MPSGRRGFALRTVATSLLVIFSLVSACALFAPKAHAADDQQYLVPDPAMWCYRWGERQVGNATGLNYHFVGMEGSARQNNAVCKYLLHVDIAENVGGAWFGGSTFVPWRTPMNWAEACALQFPGSRLQWFDPMPPPMIPASPGNELANLGFTWLCVAPADRYYNQGSADDYLND